MMAQLRLLDPSASAEVGTPERKILDTVAAAQAESEIDLQGLQSALDVDSKYGSNLDRFLGLFRMGRIQGSYAQGFVTFSRPTASPYDIRIPSGTVVRALLPEIDSPPINYYTLVDVILPFGQTSVYAPVRCNFIGGTGNIGANQITSIVGTPAVGITAVTNELPLTNGSSVESDDEFKIRFKNTVFRNVAGTEDQYLALAIATAFTTKANVVGIKSLYREYVQIPPVDDASAYDVSGNGTQDSGAGTIGEYTTALSTIPFAKAIYDTLPVFVSSGDDVPLFYRNDVDFRFNVSDIARDRGDTHRYTLDNLDFSVSSPKGQARPNLTFINVYTGAEEAVQAVRPGNVVLVEYQYLSKASRNDLTNRIGNAVDVYVDGGSSTYASTIVLRPSVATAFVTDFSSKYYYENYRRIGLPTKRPLLGNVLTPLYWQPVLDIPEQFITGSNTYFRGIHYWGVEDVSNLGGTQRARSGIEWSTTIPAKLDADSEDGPYTGATITALANDVPIEITDYSYDQNITTLQKSLDDATQVATDVLAHRSKVRYFKLDITAMYESNFPADGVNSGIQDTLNSFFGDRFFGSIIQLSDILQSIHNVPGVDNVRWSNETLPGAIRVQETDANGVPLLGVTVERKVIGNASTIDQQMLFINGEPTGGTFIVGGSVPLAYNATDADIQAALRTATGVSTLTVTEQVRPTMGVLAPIRSFVISWGAVGAAYGLSFSSALTGGPTTINNDFFLRDDELASLPDGALISDTLAGLIIRQRAQNTWRRA